MAEPWARPSAPPAVAAPAPETAPALRASPRGAWRRSRQVLVAGPVVGALLLAAALATILSPADPTTLNPRAKAQPPTLAHPLGTDEFGRDLLSRLLHGARITLVVALSSVAVAAGLGTVLGSAAAYARGPVETAIMRVMDGLLCFPPILLGIFVVTFLGPSLRNLILVIGVLYVP